MSKNTIPHTDDLVQAFLELNFDEEMMQGMGAIAIVNHHLGDFHRDNSRYMQAIPYYESAIESYLELSTEITEPVALLEHCKEIKNLKITLFQTLLAAIDFALKQKDWPLGVQAIQKALVYQPQNDLLFQKLGQCFLALEQWDSAYQFLKKSAKLNSTNEEALRLLEEIETAHLLNKPLDE